MPTSKNNSASRSPWLWLAGIPLAGLALWAAIPRNVLRTAVHGPILRDEAQSLLFACGKPKHDAQWMDGAMGRREITYPAARYHFIADDVNRGWTLISAEPEDATGTLAQAAKVMPCIRNVHFANEYLYTTY